MRWRSFCDFFFFLDKIGTCHLSSLSMLISKITGFRKLKTSMIPKTVMEKGSVYFGGQSPTFTHMLQITSIWLCASDAVKPFETRTDTQK